MSRVIYKYAMGTPRIEVPFGPSDRVLTVATQNDMPCVWVEHEYPVASKRLRIVKAVPTGSGPDRTDVYLGTAHGVMGDLVMHIYMIPEVPE